MATTNLKPFFIPNSNADWPNAEIDTSPFSLPSGSATPVPSLVKGANLLNLIFNPDTVGNYGSVNVRVAKLSGGFSSWNNVPLVGEDCTSACPAPVFSSHPSNQTLVVGSTLTLSVSVSPMTSGQWFKDGSAIAFATSTTYTKANFQVSDAGSYYFVATNDCGGGTPVSATSNVATVQQGSSSLYYNTIQSQDFTRNDCPVGETGSTVTYTVAANTYSSAISQADANNQALADIAANGQAYANANGTCSGGGGCIAITSVSLSVNEEDPDGGTDVLFTATLTPANATAQFSWQLLKNGSPVGSSLPPNSNTTQTFNVFDWNPPLDYGAYSVHVSQTTCTGAATSDTIDMVGNCRLPVLLGALPSFVVGESNDGDLITINNCTSATISGLPAGVTATGAASGIGYSFTLSGTPTTAGNGTIQVIATNDCMAQAGLPSDPNATSSATLDLPYTVSGAGSSCPTPSVDTALTPLTATEGTAYSGSFKIKNATGVTVSGLPAGLTATPTQNGVDVDVAVSGTPTENGTFAISVDATNACGGGMTTSNATGLSVGSLVVSPSGGGGGNTTITVDFHGTDGCDSNADGVYEYEFTVANTGAVPFTGGTWVANSPSGATTATPLSGTIPTVAVGATSSPIAVTVGTYANGDPTTPNEIVVSGNIASSVSDTAVYGC